MVGVTCNSLNHPIFLRRHFDYCVMDETSQILAPAAIGPLRYADVFVLVGDPNQARAHASSHGDSAMSEVLRQLPPVVTSARARENGMQVSLFKRLAETHPYAVVNLEYQYRMNKVSNLPVVSASHF